jgi:hypothetical protein
MPPYSNLATAEPLWEDFTLSSVALFTIASHSLLS